MKTFIEPIGKLINEFTRLPGVGSKTAQRFAYRIINMTDEDAQNFASAILECKKRCTTARFAATIPTKTFAISAAREAAKLYAL